jgi:peroxiredoxin
VRQLKLTEEEKKKVMAAAQEAYARRASIAAGNRGDEPSVSAAALEEAKTAEEEALREAIGPERLQKWYEILGRPFPVEKLRPPAVRAPALRPELTWIKGSAVSLDKLRGRVVLLHFWSADCDECRPNYPIIARWAEELKSRGLTVIGVRVPAENPMVGTNGAAEPSPEPAPEGPMDYAVGADDAKTTWQAWVSPPLPTTYLIDRRGFVRYWWVGEMNVRKVSGETFLHERLEELLKEP